MKRHAFGVIDLLLGLLIIIAISMYLSNTFKNLSVLQPGQKSVRQYVDETVFDIGEKRQQAIQYNMKVRQENDL